MKKNDLITLGIILLCLAMCFAGCTSGYSGKRVASKAPIVQKSTPPVVQVVYPSGLVENIHDTIGLNPKVGDTIVIFESYILYADSSVSHHKHIWGLPETAGRPLYNVDEDSVRMSYSPVVVIKKFPHKCSDASHETCDGQCECDGLACNYSSN